MWLKGRLKTTRGRGTGTKEVPWLHANAARQRSTARIVCVVLGVLLLANAIWLGPRLFYLAHFRHNSCFTLRDIAIASGETMSEMLVRDFLGLREGMSLFDPDIERRRREMLAIAPNVRSISITRRLPARLEVRVVEREPVGRVGRGGQVVDGEGVVFPRYVNTDHLPMLTGLEGIEVQPGARLDGMGLAAVRLLTCLARPEFSLPVATVDISRPDYLQLVLSDQRQVKFWWQGLDAPTANSSDALALRLKRLMHAMAAAPQRRLWDASVPDDKRIFAQ